ncbi:MAG TPA: tannase/feruloyl esterase family alpha/beta hydrolase [Bryobacteraceae bacterium]|nr:tannase/feruloyl esterase family alpha/beta hydrolase [Bryobacteraceae bacterium]
MKLLLGMIAAASTLLAADCEGLVATRFKDAALSSARTVPADGFTAPGGGAQNYRGLPAFCRVQGVIKPSADSDIQFEVWMPLSGWNGKYFSAGNGGFAGSILYAQLAAALREGYAASSTDTGHSGSATSAEWARGHSERVLDFAYRAIHETAEKSKTVIRAYYGGDPKHSYFDGCSNGGRYALMEAQRYPADYDGIIAGAAANFWTHNIAGFIWDAQALDGATIPAAKLPAIENATLAACDALDGIKDGVIDDPTRCHFQPSTLVCRGAESDQCLTAAQAAALQKIYDGPKNSRGEQIFPGYLPGGETGRGGWNRWVTGPHADQLAYGNGFFGEMVFRNPDWDFRGFQWDRDMKFTDDHWARIFNSVNPDLKPFKDRGGKLLIYHGWSDMAISPVNAVNYYNSVVAKMGREQTAEFVELFMVPGMQHCAGGPGPSSFGTNPSPVTDPDHSLFSALDRWVTSGVAPQKVIATKPATATTPERTRPLCPYPQVARYNGSGSTDDARNFACVIPESK